MRRAFCAEQVAVIERVFTAVVWKIVAAVVALAARNVGAHNDAVADAQGNSLKIGECSFPADRRDRPDIFMALDQGKFEFALTILRHESLKSVLVRAANSGHLHFEQ